MKATKDTTLFDREQPRQIEVAGRDLPGKLADLKNRGATVLSMTVMGEGRWLLSLSWPRLRQAEILPQPASLRYARRALIARPLS